MKLVRIAILKEAKDRIKSDKDTFEYCGRKDTKGHFRAMMIIDELIKEIEQDIF